MMHEEGRSARSWSRHRVRLASIAICLIGWQHSILSFSYNHVSSEPGSRDTGGCIGTRFPECKYTSQSDTQCSWSAAQGQAWDRAGAHTTQGQLSHGGSFPGFEDGSYRRSDREYIWKICEYKSSTLVHLTSHLVPLASSIARYVKPSSTCPRRCTITNRLRRWTGQRLVPVPRCHENSPSLPRASKCPWTWPC